MRKSLDLASSDDMRGQDPETKEGPDMEEQCLMLLLPLKNFVYPKTVERRQTKLH